MVAIESSVRKYCFNDNVRLSKLMLRFHVVIASSLPFSKHTSIGLHKDALDKREALNGKPSSDAASGQTTVGHAAAPATD